MEHVLFVGPNFRRRKGGIASVLAQYSRHLGESFRFYSSAHFQQTGLNFILLPFLLLGFFLYLLWNRKIAIVHIHGSFRGSFYRKYFFFLIAKNVFRKKVIYHIHGSEYHLFYERSPAWVQQRVGAMVNGVDGLIVLSREWKEWFQKHFTQPQIYILNNIVPRRKYMEKEIGPVVKLVFLGRLGKRKGIFDILEAIRLEKDAFRGRMHLYVGGDGDVARFKHFIEQHGLSEHITYLGWISGEQKTALLESAHISILPSHNEGLPISLLEAMSFGMPLVASHAGGISNILSHMRNGFVVAPGNVNSIREGIAYYLEHPEKINIHGKNSYDLVSAFFPERVFEALDRIYTDIL